MAGSTVPADPRRDTNHTRRAYELVRSLIRDGDLGVDEMLVEDRLIKTYGLPRSSIREALQRLATEGLVTRQRRSGTRVGPHYYQVPIDDILPWQTPPGFMVRRTSSGVVPATPAIQAKLGSDDAHVGFVEHVFEHLLETGPQPIGLRIAYYRAQVVQPDRWASCPSLADAFQAVFGRPLARVHTVVDAVSADGVTARQLQIAEGAPLLIREQLLEDADGVVQEYTFSHYRADRVSFPLTTSFLDAG